MVHHEPIGKNYHVKLELSDNDNNTCIREINVPYNWEVNMLDDLDFKWELKPVELNKQDFNNIWEQL